MIRDRGENVLHLHASRFNALRGVDHKIRATAFFGVRHLPRQQGFQLIRRHSPLLQTGALRICRRGHHDNGIDAPVAAMSRIQMTVTR